MKEIFFSRPRVLIASAGGMGNVGDDIVSAVTSATFKKIRRHAKVKYAALPYDRQELEWADIVVIGGGGVFYDGSIANVDNYLNFLEHAKYMGKKTIAFGVGTQGIETDYGKRRYREVLNNTTDLITVRDERDAVVLSDEVGVTSPVHVTHDLGFLVPQYSNFLMRGVSEQAKKQLDRLENLRSKGRPVVGVSIASHVWNKNFSQNRSEAQRKHSEKVYDKCVEHVRGLTNSYEVVLLMHSKDDEGLYRDISHKIEHVTTVDVTDNRDDAVVLFDLYRKLDIALVSRYHGFILSLLAQTPVAVLGSQEKVTKSINSTLPGFKKNLFTEDNLNAFFAAPDKLKNFALTSDQLDQVNNSIIKANLNIEYLRSLLGS